MLKNNTFIHINTSIHDASHYVRHSCPITNPEVGYEFKSPQPEQDTS